MNRHVQAIAGRLSLRKPQRLSLEILDDVVGISPPRKDADLAGSLAAIRAKYPSVTDFEREFPSLCFALATGVGKTRLMGAFIAYLHLARGVRNFFVLAPNLTIYQKLITDFTPNTAKYVFKGIAEFATEPPALITGDTYESLAGTLFDRQSVCKINVFNIAKITSEVRGGRAPRIKRLSEYLGQSYFEYLAALPDLVLLMDESHRYRASQGLKAINDLKPILGLELTATPFIESGKGTVAFKNVVYEYPLAAAMADGFVKEPAVVTRKDFNPSGMSTEEIERLKLEDGIRLHEAVKVELETYAREIGQPIVKPFVLVIARDTTHPATLLERIRSDAFFGGRYKDRVIQVDSSRSGAEEEEMIARLLKVEDRDEPTEIVIHVNMLKEGWDVTNLYTIVPLRAAQARVLIEQSIGRGLRLPYGRRMGIKAVDRLNIVAHDRFQEILDDASRPDSPIRLESVILDPGDLGQKTETVIVRPNLDALLGRARPAGGGQAILGKLEPAPAFTDPEEQRLALLAQDVIRRLERKPEVAPTAGHLSKPEVLQAITHEVRQEMTVGQRTIEAGMPAPDVDAVVRKSVELMLGQTISIPQILVHPKDGVRSGYRPFVLELEHMRYTEVSETLWIQYLRTGESELSAAEMGAVEEARPEDLVLSGLVDFDDVSYEDHAGLLNDLAAQVVRHFRSYLPDLDREVPKILRFHQREIARNLRAQMEKHYWEDEGESEVRVSQGYTAIKESAFTWTVSDPPLDYRVAPEKRSDVLRRLYMGFRRCLHAIQRFQSEPERRLAVILERESKKWFRPAKGQFQIWYRHGPDRPEYVPDFVAEIEDSILMLEVKARNELDDQEVRAKAAAARLWCAHAAKHALEHGAKPWSYALIPDDVITENRTLASLCAGATP